MAQKSNKRINIQPKSLLLIFVVLAVVILTYSIIELLQSKKEMRMLMEEQSHSLLETTLAASSTALLSYEEIDKEMKNRLLNNAGLIRLLLNRNQITNKVLEQVAIDNKIHRINIFNNNGKKIFTNHQPIHEDLEEKFSPKDFLHPIFEGITDTLFLGIRQARFEEGFRFAIAISAQNNSAIVLNLDAEELLNFRKKIGFGALLKNVTSTEGIKYAVLQDTNGIIAASGIFENLTNIFEDSFLQESFEEMSFKTRILESDSVSVFEAVHPFSYNEEVIGLLRLGLPADPLISANSKNETRVLLMGIILFILGSLLLAYVFTKQNFEILKKDYQIIEDYSQKVIQNVSDCVIVIDENNNINTFNKAAEELLNKSESEVLKKNFNSLFNYDIIEQIETSQSTVTSFEGKINNVKKYLLISKSSFPVKNNQLNTIIVIRDLTKQKQIEEQMNRKERLVAMGELASGVAHEIRNPLNTISTITQQLAKDFRPVENADEYYSLANLVNKEIKRINKTVQDFLRFSRPEKISLKEFELSELINQIQAQYQGMLEEKNITFDKSIGWNGKVNWDHNQIQQVLMNLMQNSIDSISGKGKIQLEVRYEEENVVIEISDNGAGMPDHIHNKIFNLYYTTKASGTGIGLSIIQRIIFEHNGTIEFESKENIGTTFIIRLPINAVSKIHVS